MFSQRIAENQASELMFIHFKQWPDFQKHWASGDFGGFRGEVFY